MLSSGLGIAQAKRIARSANPGAGSSSIVFDGVTIVSRTVSVMTNCAVDAFSYSVDSTANSTDSVSSNAANTRDGAGDGRGYGVVNCAHDPSRCHVDGLILLGEVLELGRCFLGCFASYGCSVVRVDLLNPR